MQTEAPSSSGSSAPPLARRALDVVNVANPCPKNWNEMTGDSQRRFCTHCQKHVHNLSAMAADDAERLVCQSAGKLCVRFERDARGKMITLDYAESPAAPRGRMGKVFALLLGAIFTSAAALGLRDHIARPRWTSISVGDMNMGGGNWVACPAPATQPTTIPATHPADGSEADAGETDSD